MRVPRSFTFWLACLRIRMSSLVHLEFLDVKKLIAVPLCPARPHRPMRWTYDWRINNIRYPRTVGEWVGGQGEGGKEGGRKINT